MVFDYLFTCQIYLWEIKHSIVVTLLVMGFQHWNQGFAHVDRGFVLVVFDINWYLKLFIQNQILNSSYPIGKYNASSLIGARFKFCLTQIHLCGTSGRSTHIIILFPTCTLNEIKGGDGWRTKRLQLLIMWLELYSERTTMWVLWSSNSRSHLFTNLDPNDVTSRSKLEISNTIPIL